MALLRAKFVQLTKDIVNIRAITDPIEDEDDNETVHGFVENRTVFGASGELFQYDHWPSIQKYLRQSYISKSHCDVSIIVSDGTIEVNRLIILLLFPVLLQACHEDLESVISMYVEWNIIYH